MNRPCSARHLPQFCRLRDGIGECRHFAYPHPAAVAARGRFGLSARSAAGRSEGPGVDRLRQRLGPCGHRPVRRAQRRSPASCSQGRRGGAKPSCSTYRARVSLSICPSFAGGPVGVAVSYRSVGSSCRSADLTLPIWRTGECLLHASRLASGGLDGGGLLEVFAGGGAELAPGLRQT